MTFFEKRDKWENHATKQIIANPDIVMHWTDDSNLSLKPDGTVTIKYPRLDIEDIVFENAVISIRDFFDKLNKEDL